MKHLIETTDPSGLTIAEYDRIILNSSKDDVIVRGGYEYVDLGLPSRLKWAKCNIGAKTEMDYGDYFMWGSTKPNTDTPCNWANAPFNDGAETFDEGYFTAHKSEWLDDNGNLKPEFDAATQIMGDGWRMPTKDDFQELLDNTIVNRDSPGITKVISKTDASKYILFIYAGFRSDSDFIDSRFENATWSSSLDTSEPQSAWCLGTEHYAHQLNQPWRCYGCSVRGVCN